MTSLTESERSNSFEDAENGNTGSGVGVLVDLSVPDKPLAGTPVDAAWKETSKNDVEIKKPSVQVPSIQIPESAIPNGPMNAGVVTSNGYSAEDSVPKITPPTELAPGPQRAAVVKMIRGVVQPPPKKEVLSPTKRGAGHATYGAEAAMAVGVSTIETSDTQSLSVTDDAGEDGNCFSAAHINCHCCRCCPTWRRPSWSLCFLGSCVALVGMFLVAMFVVSPYITQTLHKELVLRPGRENWIHPPANVVVNIYFFSVDNPVEVAMRKETPRLTQMGPYAYKFEIEKVNVTWNNNDTVSYQKHFTFKFDSASSNGSESDKINTANIPLVAMGDAMGGAASWFEGFMLSSKSKQLIETHTVEQLMWGYKSLVLQEMHEKTKMLNSLHLVDEVPTTFGFFAQESTRTSKVYNVYTGKKNFSRLNEIYSWGYQRKLNYWLTDEANTIHGTDGSVFQPGVDEKSKLTIFSAPLFRTFTLKFQKTHHDHGLKVFRFIISDTAFANFSETSENMVQEHVAPTSTPIAITSSNSHHTSEKAVSKDATSLAPNGHSGEKTSDHSINPTSNKSAYCVPRCIPNGVYSIEACVKAPFYISLPHFLGADPVYRSQVVGLNPQEDMHRPIWDVDTVTGVTIYNRRRHQLNLKLGSGKSGQTYLPILWLDVDARVDDHTLGLLRKATAAKLAVTIIITITIGLVALLFVGTIGLIIFNLATGRTTAYRHIKNEADQHNQDTLCSFCNICSFRRGRNAPEAVHL